MKGGDFYFFALQGLLIYQKLHGIIDWDWALVLAPSLFCLFMIALAVCVAGWSKS